mmetsp:Transcript_173427/g.421834  ORF Transcript_173427/g.421834 Transcript_173427/m.421834 type:complete len:523 (+) Transcript_173427:286-1854(+)
MRRTMRRTMRWAMRRAMRRTVRRATVERPMRPTERRVASEPRPRMASGTTRRAAAAAATALELAAAATAPRTTATARTPVGARICVLVDHGHDGSRRLCRRADHQEGMRGVMLRVSIAGLAEIEVAAHGTLVAHALDRNHVALVATDATVHSRRVPGSLDLQELVLAVVRRAGAAGAALVVIRALLALEARTDDGTDVALVADDALVNNRGIGVSLFLGLGGVAVVLVGALLSGGSSGRRSGNAHERGTQQVNLLASRRSSSNNVLRGVQRNQDSRQHLADARAGPGKLCHERHELARGKHSLHKLRRRGTSHEAAHHVLRDDLHLRRHHDRRDGHRERRILAKRAQERDELRPVRQRPGILGGIGGGRSCSNAATAEATGTANGGSRRRHRRRHGSCRSDAHARRGGGRGSVLLDQPLRGLRENGKTERLAALGESNTERLSKFRITRERDGVVLVVLVGDRVLGRQGAGRVRKHCLDRAHQVAERERGVVLDAEATDFLAVDELQGHGDGRHDSWRGVGG